MSTDKKERRRNQTTEASGMPYTPEALASLMAQQQIRKPDEWKPSIINYQASGVPSVQTQLAGTQHYDTTTNQFVAPGYEHLKELSIKKDLEGKQYKSKYENTMDTIAGMDVGNNPTHIKALQNIQQAAAKHTENLRQGVWGYNTDMVNDFTKDVVTNKGLSQLIAVKAQQAEANEKIRELTGDYDPVNGGGIPPDEIEYAMQNSGTVNDAVMDENGNMLNTLSFKAKPIYEHRNMPKEVGDTTSKLMASATVRKDEDGNFLYQLAPNQYGITSNEYVTEAQVRAKVEDYLYLNGGNDYLKHKARVSAFNNIGGVTLDGLKLLVKQGAEMEGENGGIFTDLSSADDKKLLQEASGILAASEFRDMRRSLLNGAEAANAYNKEELSFFNDTDGLARDKEARDAKAAKLAGIEPEVNKFSFFTTSSQSVEALNPSNTYNINKELSEIGAEIMNGEAALKSMKASGSFDNAKYAEVQQGIQNLKNREKTIRGNVNTLVNGYGDYIWQTRKISFSQLYDQDYLPSMKGKDPVDRDYFLNTLTAAIAAESDNDSKTTAHDILSKSKLGLGISSTRAKGLGSFNKKISGIAGPLSMGTGGGSSVHSDENLLTFATSVGKDLKKAYTDNKSGVSGALMPGTKTLQSDLIYINKIEGATTTDVEASSLNSNITAISNQTLGNLEGVKMYNIDGSPGKSFPLAMKDEFNIDSNVLKNIFDLTDKSDTGSMVLPTTTQTYGNAGAIAFALKLKLKPITKDMSPDEKRAIEKIQAKIGANTHYETRVSLGANQKQNEELIGKSVKALYLSNALGEKVPRVILQQAALVHANVTGLSKAIDAARINDIPVGPNSSKRNDIVDGDRKYHLSAFSTDNGKSKMFTMEVDEGNGKFFLTNNGTDEPSYHTQAEIDKNPKLQKMVFNNDLEVKSFISMGRLERERQAKIDARKINFNEGGAGSSSVATMNFTRKTAPTYKNIVTLANGKQVEQTTYVKNLADLSKSVKFLPSAGIPMVSADVADKATNVFNTYGLTIGGGLRTKEHQVKGSAENSKHYAGYSLDVANDANSAAFTKKIIGNKALQKQLGIAWADVHDVGNGKHLHLEFAPPTKGNTPIDKSWGGTVMNAIAMGESGNNPNIGNHYADKKANSSAHGRYGFTDFWYNKMATYYGKTAEEVKKDPKLIDQYAKTQYIEEAKKEIKPIFDKAKSYLRRFKPDLDMTDAMLAYHYAGGNFFRDLANGRRSLYEIPRQDKGNKLTILEYIKNKRKYI